MIIKCSYYLTHCYINKRHRHSVNALNAGWEDLKLPCYLPATHPTQNFHKYLSMLHLGCFSPSCQSSEQVPLGHMLLVQANPWRPAPLFLLPLLTSPHSLAILCLVLPTSLLSSPGICNFIGHSGITGETRFYSIIWCA